MKGLKSLIFFLILSQCALAQDTINQYDANGLRHGVWKKYFPRNHNLRYSGQFNHGKEVGIFKYYDINNDKIPIVVRKFNLNDSSEEVSFFTKKGIIESKGKMLGKWHIGKWIFYHKDGKSILSEEFYKNGKINGESKVYYANGKLTEVLHYLNGKLNGNYKRYSVRGFLYQDLTYINGVLNGLATYYNRKTGKLLAKGNFKDNKRVGIWQHFKNDEFAEMDSTNNKYKKPKN